MRIVFVLYPTLTLLRNFETLPRLLIELELGAARHNITQNIFSPLCLNRDCSEPLAELGVVGCVHDLNLPRLRVELYAIIIALELFGRWFVLTRRWSRRSRASGMFGLRATGPL